jgi:hypothetical protein
VGTCPGSSGPDSGGGGKAKSGQGPFSRVGEESGSGRVEGKREATVRMVGSRRSFATIVVAAELQRDTTAPC